MLLDRGALVQEGSVYRPLRAIEALDVPEMLHALIAARLDGLSPEGRRLLQDGSVLGKTFTRAALAALAGLAAAELDPLLHSLVRKEVLSLQSDPRSPEHRPVRLLPGPRPPRRLQTLCKRERTGTPPCSCRAPLPPRWPRTRSTEVVASHLVEAYQLDPDADDAPAIKERAKIALVSAGERAASLAAAAEAERYFEQAAELAEGPSRRAELLGRAGEMAGYAGDPDTAAQLIEQSIAIYEAEGDTHAAARASG